MIIYPMFILSSLMVCVKHIEVDQPTALCVCVCGHIRLACNWSGTVYLVQCGGCLARVQVSQGGAEVLRYHRGVLRYAMGGAQGLGGESTASCINYTGKNPPRTHKNYQLA